MAVEQLTVITRRQMAAMARPPRERFEREVAVRARRFFPRLVVSMADQELQRVVRSAVTAGYGLGLSAAADLARHVYLTIVLGAELQDRFDWAARIIGSGGSAALRHRRLYCEAIDRLRRGLDPRAHAGDEHFEEEPEVDGQ